jgi:hypothetical protein
MTGGALHLLKVQKPQWNIFGDTNWQTVERRLFYEDNAET